MRKLLLPLAAAALVATPAASRAQLQLGVRVGYGFATGEVVAGDDQADFIEGQIPFQLDLDYEITKNLAVGAYFSYALGLLGDPLADSCDQAGSDCSARAIRAGLQVAYDFAPGAPLDPWVGLGVGYEWAMVSGEVPLAFQDPKIRGWELVSLQLGADWALSRDLGVGPFLSWSLGQYRSRNVDGLGWEEIGERGNHQLLQVGVRGLFTF